MNLAELHPHACILTVSTYGSAELPSGAQRASRDGDGAGLPKTSCARVDVTQNGVAMIGDLRTDVLHQALRGNEIDDQTLIGLLVLALAGKNVTVQSPVERVDLPPYGRPRRHGLALP